MSTLTDTYGRQITYLRLSVTDRCDLRCTYCMAEHMQFLPRKDLLTLEELAALSEAFIDRGVKKLRITGGEPLVRRDIMTLFAALGRHLETGGLEELTLTTNATQLERFASELASIGVRRVNISLDSLDEDRFEQITRRRNLSAVLRGIDAAQNAGLKVKLNTVALKHLNRDEIPAMIEWSHKRDIDLTLIEVMPLGETGEDRFDQYVPLSEIQRDLESRWSLQSSTHRTGGPSRYYHIAETGGLLGLITPLTNNFCAGCNRVRVTCTGQIYMCLGSDAKVDLRAALRSEDPDQALQAALDIAMYKKPERHEFDISKPGQAPTLERHMSVTGG